LKIQAFNRFSLDSGATWEISDSDFGIIRNFEKLVSLCIQPFKIPKAFKALIREIRLKFSGFNSNQEFQDSAIF